MTQNESDMIVNEAIESLGKSAIFTMSLSSKELFHSNLLQWIFSVDRDMFKGILFRLGVDIELHGNTEVLREYNHFDLCVIHKEPANGNAECKEVIDLVIENKVKSIPNEIQLKGYMSATKKSRHLLLTVISDFAGKESVTEGWVIASYKQLANAMEEAKLGAQSLASYHSAIIDDYIVFIRNLNTIVDQCSIYNTPCYGNKYRSELNKLGINDIVEKLRACEMAIELKRIIGDNCYEAVDRKTMFKDHKKGDVIINYGFSHSNGFFELKVLVETNKPKIALVVQIQGDHYCHAIELCETGRKHPSNWDVYSNDPDFRWFLCPNDDFTTSLHRGYNKFGEEFLYRYRKIDELESVDSVINNVYSDYIAIINYFGLKSATNC